MFRIARAPPVTGLALAAGAGASLLHLGVSLPWTLAPLPIFLLLDPPWTRPEPGSTVRVLPLYLAFLAGAVLTHSWASEQARDCRLRLSEGRPMEAVGTLTIPVREGRSVFRALDRGLEGCRDPVRVFLRGEGAGSGRPLRLWGRWQKSGGEAAARPLYAGYLLVDSLVRLPPRGSRGEGEWARTGPRAVLERLGGAVQARLGELYPRQEGLAAALVWARKEGLEPGVRDAFARAGTAHLLAISGFHVGVVAGLLLLLGGMLGLAHPARFLFSSLGVWSYVVAIGLPDAALRAALILSVLALGRLLGRAVVSLGALSSAFLFFLALDPGSLLRPGFQLSFAGALGLVLGSRSLSGGLRSIRPISLLPGLASAIAAGVTATLATLLLVAWHFGRISLVGIPMTLLAAPLVTLAIPGLFITLLLSLIHSPTASFLAAGVEWVLHLLGLLVEAGASLPFASVWVSRPSIVAASAGVLAGWMALAFLPGVRGGAGSQGRGTRRGSPNGAPRVFLPLWGALAALTLAPLAVLVVDRGTVELVALDVGQGDAILLRSPGGRWILVDAGPRTESYDAGARVVLPYLRRRGVSELELLVLTHPDMDHVGGAPAILRDFRVERVAGPGVAVGKEVFLEALDAAGAGAVPWTVVSAGDSMNLDGMALRVLAPDSASRSRAAEDANEGSVVMELRYGDFAALLTGDAPISVEEAALPRLLSGRVQLLKAGHHGSSTSTGRALLSRLRPRVAVISVGKHNRYGHPHAQVLRSLEDGGVRVLRTDQAGTLSVRAWKDGRFKLR